MSSLEFESCVKHTTWDCFSISSSLEFESCVKRCNREFFAHSDKSLTVVSDQIKNSNRLRSLMLCLFIVWSYVLFLWLFSCVNWIVVQIFPRMEDGATSSIGFLHIQHRSTLIGRVWRLGSFQLALHVCFPITSISTPLVLHRLRFTCWRFGVLIKKDCYMVTSFCFVLSFGWLSHMEYSFWHCFFPVLVDINEILCNLELIIQRVKAMPTPDGRVLDMFFITDGM